MDRKTWSASINGRPLPLTLMEFQILGALLDPPGWVKQKRELMETVLEKKYNPGDHSLNIHICNLRRKLGHPYQSHLKTVRGVGFAFEVAELDSSVPTTMSEKKQRRDKAASSQDLSSKPAAFSASSCQ